MATLHRFTTETLNLMRLVAEDQSEDRITYRNELRRISAPGLTMPFSEYEHFLEHYGYWSLDSRLDSFTLSSTGLGATKGDEGRVKSLDEDIRHHFSKAIEQGASERSMNSSGQRFDQHYIRFEGIGRGGVGSVWRGEHLKTGRPVAIKTLEGLDEVMVVGRKSTLKKKIERVMRSVAQLSHPFVTPVLDLSVHHSPPYYVMPLCTGGSLRDLIAQGPISPELGLNIFAQICLGLAQAHEVGVLHLDLKPENILIDKAGNAQIFDFGLSRVVAKQVAQAGRQSYVGFGSVAYMPPELLRDPLMESPTIDIYALGLILYEILVGELPGRRSPMPSEVIKDLPLPIDDLFDMMVQDIPAKRPQTMSAVLEVLNKVEPFNRLSQKSMVLIFDHLPESVTLPGLKYLEIPDPSPELSELSMSGSDSSVAEPSASAKAESSSSESSKPQTSLTRGESSSARSSTSVPRLDATRRFEERLKSSSRETVTKVVSPGMLSALKSSVEHKASSADVPAEVSAESRIESSAGPSVDAISEAPGAAKLVAQDALKHTAKETPVLHRSTLDVALSVQEPSMEEPTSPIPRSAVDNPKEAPLQERTEGSSAQESADEASPAPLAARARLSGILQASSSIAELDELEELIELDDLDDLDDFADEEATALHDQPVSVSQPSDPRPPTLSSISRQEVLRTSERATSSSPIQERLAKKYGPRST